MPRSMYSRVYVEITNICNLTCSFCHKTVREKKRMSMDEFALILGKLEGVTEYIYFHVMGEPLTHPMLHEFVSYASEHGYKPVITTNGTLLSTVGAGLVGSGLYKMNISLHCECGGNTEDYIRSCLDFADEASRSGILVIMRLWNSGGSESEFNKTVLDIIHRRFSGCELVNDTRGMRIRNRLHLEYGERFEWPDSELNDIEDNVYCHGLRDHFGILVDGSVVPCCLDAEGDCVLGNIFSEDIQKILSSERAVNLKRGFENRKAVEELCKRCGYARRFKV